MKPREAGRIVIRINKTIPVGWIKLYLPLHFGNRATKRYGYTPRSGERGSGRRFKGSYTELKLKTYGHTRPLEHSGESRRDTEANNNALATKKKATANLPGARGYNRRHKGSRIRMVQELTAVLETENNSLNDIASRKAEAEYNRAGRRI